jgi:hypothetical protein
MKEKDFPSVKGVIKDREIELVVRLAFFTGARISSIYALTPDSLKDGKIFF